MHVVNRIRNVLRMKWLMRRSPVVLASYPKSGNTWVRFIVAHAIRKLEKLDLCVDFHTINDIVPSLELPSYHVQHFWDVSKRCRVVKTHSVWRPKFMRVILVIRDPADVMYSYFKYLNGDSIHSIELGELIESKVYGISAYTAFFESYMRRVSEILVVSYERLQSDCLTESARILRYLNWEIGDRELSEIVELTSFALMRELEVKRGRPGSSGDFRFVHSGRAGDGFNSMCDSDLQRIYSEIRKSPTLSYLYGGKYVEYLSRRGSCALGASGA